MVINTTKDKNMEILSWIVVGLIGGWLANQLIRRPRYGILGVTILGVVGGMLGGFLASRVLNLNYSVTGINLVSVLTAFVGSILLLLLIGFVNARRI
jgi:uncharacterized membrane protein YeaQ/YmgE (transglycosylase-associated protein family)